MFYLSQRSKDRMKGIDERLILIAEEAIKITRIDFGIPQYGGLRTAAEQHQLFLDGKSRADGYKYKSKHQLGRALDFYAIDPETKRAVWHDSLLAQVACAFLQSAAKLKIPLEWGGLWKGFKDFPHVQLPEED